MSKAKQFVTARLIKSQLHKHGRIVVVTRRMCDNVLKVHTAQTPPWQPEPDPPSARPIAA